MLVFLFSTLIGLFIFAELYFLRKISARQLNHMTITIQNNLNINHETAYEPIAEKPVVVYQSQKRY